MFQEEEVKEFIKNGVSAKIADAREYADLCNMHITGKNIKKHTEEFNKYENTTQKELREKLIKSNKALFSFTLRPLDKVFTAKGGFINYNLPQSRTEIIQEALQSVNFGQSIKQFLRSDIKTKYVIDPNSFVMVDLNMEGEYQFKTFGTDEVIHYENKGKELNLIIFNPFEKEDDDKKYYRVIDEKTDSIYIEDGENIYLDESSIISNPFGYVPAYILGDLKCPNTNKYLSIIDEVLDDANEHLRDVSVNVVHKLSQGFAKYWQYPENCSTCNGHGSVKRSVENEIKETVCPTCRGNKVKNHKDASDLMIVPIPREGDPILAPNFGGYINPSLEIWKQYKEDIQDLKFSIFQTIWGSAFTTIGDNETATGKLLNVQPEAERVANVSKTFEKIHEFLLTTLGKIVLGNTNYESSVSYGTRYLMETPDQILNTLKEAKTNNLPIIVQRDLTDKYYQSEYANNNIEYQKVNKTLKVDPFPTLSAKDVKELGITGNDLYCKIYYPQWLNQLKEAKATLMTVDELKEDLKQYSLNKIKENGEVQQNANEPTKEGVGTDGNSSID